MNIRSQIKAHVADEAQEGDAAKKSASTSGADESAESQTSGSVREQPSTLATSRRVEPPTSSSGGSSDRSPKQQPLAGGDAEAAAPDASLVKRLQDCLAVQLCYRSEFRQMVDAIFQPVTREGTNTSRSGSVSSSGPALPITGDSTRRGCAPAFPSVPDAMDATHLLS